MCRFALYLGSPILVRSLITDPTHSIIHQSFHSRERREPLNGDGFGMAWFVPELTSEPAIFKDVRPAWNNPNLLHLARVTRSSCLLAHVRAASPGLPVSYLNCHPFVQGPFAFMHNGTIGGYSKMVRKLKSGLSDRAYAQIEGSTDSEHIFALFMDYFESGGAKDQLQKMVTSLSCTIRHLQTLKRELGIDESCWLNLAVADGTRAVVSRFCSGDPDQAHSLYVHSGEQFVCEQGVCRMLPAGGASKAVVVASEPLTDGPGWQEVAPNHFLVVDDRLRVEQVPIEL